MLLSLCLATTRPSSASARRVKSAVRRRTTDDAVMPNPVEVAAGRWKAVAVTQRGRCSSPLVRPSSPANTSRHTCHGEEFWWLEMRAPSRR